MTVKLGKRSGLHRGIAVFLLAFTLFWTFGGELGSEAFAEDSIEVKCTYDKKYNYEDYHTFNFRVVYGQDTLTAYCVQPKKRRMSKGAHNAVPYENGLVRKILYYSSGYPGFEEKTAGYIDSVERKDCYKGDKGNYIMCHLLLSYAFSGKSPDSGAFKGLSSGSVQMVKDVIAEMETWPDPPEMSGASFDQNEVTAELNQETGEQETPYIKFNADPAETIELPVPEGASVVKRSNDGTEEGISPEPGGTVSIAGGESFKITAPADTDGTYTSPGIECSASSFGTYIINKNHRQSIVFGTGSRQTISYSVKWSPGTVDKGGPGPSIKTTAKAGENGTIVDEVSYTGLEAGTEYKLAGQLMDKKEGTEIGGMTAETSFTPEKSEGTVTVTFKPEEGVLSGKTVVVFEKLYKGEEVIASHEDIDDEAQTVTVEAVEQPPAETEEQPPAELSGRTDETEGKADKPSPLPDTSVKAADESPVTGDESKVAAMMMIAVGALLILCGCAAFRKRV